ncbi:MAG: hypothetical protein MUF34_33745 [Polyangiaceae bacterium]|nr:hypothetical protein [Polyangiaceae bacterium]
MNLRRSGFAFSFLALAALGACKGDKDAPATDQAGSAGSAGSAGQAGGGGGGQAGGGPAAYTFLSPTEHLVRASMALRGMRPSEAELAQVQADAAAVGAIVDTYLATPEFARHAQRGAAGEGGADCLSVGVSGAGARL